jgi:hypothetical protein
MLCYCTVLVNTNAILLELDCMLTKPSNTIAICTLVLLYTLTHLQIHTQPATLAAFVASADGDNSRFVRDYARRVLTKLPEDSGDEAD